MLIETYRTIVKDKSTYLEKGFHFQDESASISI